MMVPARLIKLNRAPRWRAARSLRWARGRLAAPSQKGAGSPANAFTFQHDAADDNMYTTPIK